MTEFHDVRFPISLAFGASGGPEFTTQITQLSSGKEYRNAPHSLPRRKYDAIAGIKSKEQLYEITKFFISRKGQLCSFRFFDPFDHCSCSIERTPSELDQTLAQGDGMTTEFQLIKDYDRLKRPITKPVKNSVLIAVDGESVSPPDVAIDYLTGIITFASPPNAGAVLTAGFSFDTVVRFDTDFLDMTLEDFGAGQMRSLPMVELPYA